MRIRYEYNFNKIDWPICPHCKILLNTYDYLPARSFIQGSQYPVRANCPSCDKIILVRPIVTLSFEIDSELSKLEYAMKYASEKHINQRYGEHPYDFHLKGVESVLRGFDITTESILVAAWLHDVVEDTGTKIEEIESKFGKEVSEIVWCITNEPGKNRKERTLKTYPKIKANKNASILKLADRISNVEQCLRDNSSLLEMYKREYKTFKENLYSPDLDPMWNYLDNLLK